MADSTATVSYLVEIRIFVKFRQAVFCVRTNFRYLLSLTFVKIDFKICCFTVWRMSEDFLTFLQFSMHCFRYIIVYFVCMRMLAIIAHGPERDSDWGWHSHWSGSQACPQWSCPEFTSLSESALKAFAIRSINCGSIWILNWTHEKAMQLYLYIYLFFLLDSELTIFT